MPGLPGFSALSFLDKYLIGYALGTAAGPALYPFIQDLEVQAYAAAQFAPLPPEIAAQVAAENYANLGPMETEASFSGLNKGRFDFMYDVTLTAPGMGELLAMARRGTLQKGQFAFGLRKAKLDTQWDAALTDLQNVYLSPDILAVMLQRSVIPNQGQLPGVAPAAPGKVPVFPQVPIDAYKMASTFGWSPEQLDAQTHIQGLPPGMDLVARGVFRGIFDPGDFELAAEQSNRRVEWAPLEFDVYRQIPTSHDFIEGYLRGWISQQAMYAGTALHGMSQADTDLIYDISGRPLATHQITTGLARGGTYGGHYAGVPSPYLEAMEQSNVRPEWGNIDYANRYTYPSAFVLRSLATAGDLGNTAAVQQVLEEIGWSPKFASQVATAWTAPTTGTGTAAAKPDPWVVKAHNHLWTAVQKGYISGAVDQPNATQSFNVIGIDPTVYQQIFAAWDETKRIEAL